MATNVVKMESLDLLDESSGKRYTIMIPEGALERCRKDAVLSDMMYQSLLRDYPIKEGNHMALTSLESIQLLSKFGLMDNIVHIPTSTSKCMTVDARVAKFDDITVKAYSKDISDETLMKISNSAPKNMNTKEKVRYMEVMTASLPLSEDSDSNTNDHESQTDQTEKQIEDFSGSQFEETADGSEKSQGDQVKWNHEAVLLLLSVKRENANLFSSHLISQKQAWRKISEEICLKGHHFTGEECDKKFRSLKLRYKIIKERNKKTGSDRHSWKYFDLMDEMFRGDPAVQPITSVSSLENTSSSISATSPTSSTSSNSSCEKNPASSLPEKLIGNLSSPSPPPQKKRRHEKEPSWVSDYRTELKEMHAERIKLDKERMEIEARRVASLEKLVELMSKKSSCN